MRSKLIIIVMFTTAIIYQSFLGNAAEDNRGAASEMDLDKASATIIDRINAFRRDHQLSALSIDSNLTQSAQTFAQYMAQTKKYGHNADGRTPAERAKAAGYDYCSIRENIAYRMDSRDITTKDLANTFTQGWIDSPGHRENLLAEYATETGVGVATTDGLTFFAVQLFGRPKSASYGITLTNNTGSMQTLIIESKNGLDSMDLSPRTILNMQRCSPVTITIEDSSIAEKVENSVNLEINQSDAGKLHLTRK
jgi:uncharacterized protein YkwD